MNSPNVDALETQSYGESQKIGKGDVDKDIADEGHLHHRHHLPGAAQHIGVAYLHGVAKLIDHQRDNHGKSHRQHASISGEHTHQRSGKEQDAH